MKKKEKIKSKQGYIINTDVYDANMDYNDIKNVIICCHGFASSKDNNLFFKLASEAKNMELQ